MIDIFLTNDYANVCKTRCVCDWVRPNTTPVPSDSDDPNRGPPMDTQITTKAIPVRISRQTGSHSQGDGLRNSHATNVGEYLFGRHNGRVGGNKKSLTKPSSNRSLIRKPPLRSVQQIAQIMADVSLAEQLEHLARNHRTRSPKQIPRLVPSCIPQANIFNLILPSSRMPPY